MRNYLAVSTQVMNKTSLMFTKKKKQIQETKAYDKYLIPFSKNKKTP